MLLHEQVINTLLGCFTSARKTERVPIQCAKILFKCESELAWIRKLYERSKKKSNEKNHRRKTHADEIESSKTHFKRLSQYCVNAKDR